MRVAGLSLDNFRGIQTAVVHFKQHTVLVGANNTGKRAVIEALTLLLGTTNSSENLLSTISLVRRWQGCSKLVE